MSQPQSVQEIFERTPPRVLRKGLHKAGLEMPGVWDDCPEDTSEPAYPAFERLPQADRDRAEPWLNAVLDFSDREGVRLLHQFAARDGVTVPVNTENLIHPAAVASWLSVEKPRLFEEAVAFRQYLDLSKRNLQERTDLSGLSPNTSSEALRRLEAKLAAYFETREKRGRRVTVRVVRHNGRSLFIAHLDDYPDSITTHEHGLLAHRVIHPTFAVSFLFDPDRGSLAVNVPGGREVRAAVETAFMEALLDRVYTPPPAAAVYHLMHLFDAGEMFGRIDGSAATAAGVEFVRFRHVPSGRVYTFTVAPGGSETAASVFAASFNRKAVSGEDVEILHAKFRFHHAGETKRGKLFRVGVTCPDRSTLKTLPPHERLIGEDHLRAWRVMDE